MSWHAEKCLVCGRAAADGDAWIEFPRGNRFWLCVEHRAQLRAGECYCVEDVKLGPMLLLRQKTYISVRIPTEPGPEA